MSSGSITTGKIVFTEESFTLDELIDVTAPSSSNNDVLLYKNNTIDANFTTGWHSTPLQLDDVADAYVATPAQSDLLAYNISASDPTYGADDGWVPKNVASVFTELESTVNSIVNSQTAKLLAEDGDTSVTDMVMFSEGSAPVGGSTVKLGSCCENNTISKKEISDSVFSFVQTLDAGETTVLTYTAGTVFRSTRGIYGFSGPILTPLGPLSFAMTRHQFYTSTASAVLSVASIGTEISVTLFSGDQTTLVSGPTTITSYGVQTFTCGVSGEYYVQSSGPMLCSVNESGSKIRLLAPMSTELITWNPSCTVSSLETGTSVTWYRRSGTTGTQTANAGTPLALGAGSNTNLNPNGLVLIKADNPISSFTDTDSIGTQALSGWPLSQLAQCFPNPSYLDSNTSYGSAGVAIGSPYEGTATVFNSLGTVVDSFVYTRSVAVTTAADQQYPAGGRWKPSDVTGSTVLDGGYIQTNTPAICIMNSSSDPTWNTAGQEMFIAGSTPDDIRADIKKDPNGIYRRRDISGTGVSSWVIC